MNIGKLNHRITVQRYIETIDEHGISHGEWGDLTTIWCSMNNLYGKEYWAAKQYKAENTVEFTIRYNACESITVQDRIVYRSKVFNITSVDNVLYKNEMIKIKAYEGSDLNGAK